MLIPQKEFDAILEKVVDEINPRASMLLSIPGVYEILSEEYNNFVLDDWKAQAEDEE